MGVMPLALPSRRVWRLPHKIARLMGIFINSNGEQRTGSEWLRIKSGGATPPSTPWYLSGGATGVIFAYQPKSAASYAASKSNLANPGTNDAAEGVAPTWAAGTGWAFNGSTQYLQSYAIGADPTDSGLTCLVQFSGMSGSWGGVCGGSYLQMYPKFFGNAFVQTILGKQYYDASIPDQAAGNLGLTPNHAYLNGARGAAALTGGGSHPSGTFKIGNDGGSTFAAVTVIALVLYNNELSDAAITAVAAAMAAL